MLLVRNIIPLSVCLSGVMLGSVVSLRIFYSMFSSASRLQTMEESWLCAWKCQLRYLLFNHVLQMYLFPLSLVEYIRCQNGDTVREICRQFEYCQGTLLKWNFGECECWEKTCSGWIFQNAWTFQNYVKTDIVINEDEVIAYSNEGKDNSGESDDEVGDDINDAGGSRKDDDVENHGSEIDQHFAVDESLSDDDDDIDGSTDISVHSDKEDGFDVFFLCVRQLMLIDLISQMIYIFESVG